MKLKKMNISISLYALLSFVFHGCENDSIKKIKIPIADYKVNISKREYNRDSIYLIFTINEFEKNEYSRFYPSIPNKQIFIDTILYSSDKLKLFAFSIIKSPIDRFTKKKFPEADLMYDGMALVGYRNNIKEPWVVYEFNQYYPAGWLKYIEVQNLMRNFYFYDFKNQGTQTWDAIKNDWQYEYFKYNVNQKNFWDKGVVWRKGANIPGYYNFQLRGGYKPGDTGFEVELPPIIYPDSLLQMFKK